ncbi:metallophosphoesterase family protein [Paraburkholderia pallida]|uniref:Calcineurin-like phosphoesterase domain-containing protein n=1 Tax=Paraburkholderia pallida TaxID=2547399 RepID=A0A4P7D3H6_9BURK|nr:metallophosphoesterase family protein [Paraburkholderia pallida]QBR02508.1 hypothetical protein E1956_35295 [Paraburkholderia pallida]
MKLHIASDMHMHTNRSAGPDERVQPVDADALILAGDIDCVERVGERYADWPYEVLYVRGNHDTYLRCYEQSIAQAVLNCATGRVRFLERSCISYPGVRVLGCCLWTDFELIHRQHDAMILAGFSGRDYRLNFRADGKRLAPADTLTEHRLSVEWLERELKAKFRGTTVVVTHHAPHVRSLDPSYGVNSYSTVFASDLTRLLRHTSLWIHGHTHFSSAYKVKHCRVICNPAGSISRPNPDFVPDLLVEI